MSASAGSVAAGPLPFPDGCDIVLPLFDLQWSTRAVLEGLFARYTPRAVYVITPEANREALLHASTAEAWRAPRLHVIPEEGFFTARHGRTKQDLASTLDLAGSLYKPGWFYQQLLKLGADEGIASLSDAFLVWDADLLLVGGWPAVEANGRPCYALLQDSSRGNAEIVSRWSRWIRSVLGVEPAVDPAGRATFVPHHMWFVQQHLRTLRERIADYYGDRATPWPELMMRSAGEFGTFSEFWLYASWVAARHSDTAPHALPYHRYGATTERFFEDGTAPFAQAARQYLDADPEAPFRPAYVELVGFIEQAYADAGRPLPSSLSFEASPRHRHKGRANMHVEELRSPWHTAAD